MEAGGALRGTCCWEVQARAKGQASPPCSPALCVREERLLLKGTASSEILMKTFRNEDSKLGNSLISEAPTMQTGK